MLPDIFKVIVKTNACENKFLSYSLEHQAYLVSLQEPAENNRANKALLKLLSKELGKKVLIKSGLTSKVKLIQVINS